MPEPTAQRAATSTQKPRTDRASRGRHARARRGEGDRLRAEIIDAAGRLLAASGDAASLSLRAIAREVGIATTSIYLHFDTLDAVLLAVKTEYFADFGRALDDAADRAGTPAADRVRARAHAYLRYGQDHPGQYRALFDAPMLPPDLATQVGRSGAQVFDTLRQDVAAAVDGPGQETDLIAVHLWTALHGTVSLRTARPHFPWPDPTVEIDSLVTRLLAHPQPKARSTTTGS